MRRTLLYAVCLAGILGAASCSEKFDIAAPYKNVTVVYSFINLSDTAHYVRIEKGFMNQDKSGVDMAKIADSSYYADLDVKVKEMVPGNPNPFATFTLTRVNMADENYPKDAGAFFTSPSYAYKFKAPLNPAHRYRLVITNNQSHEVDSAETGIIDTAYTHFNVTEFFQPSLKTISIAKKNSNNKFGLQGTIVSPGDSSEAPAGIKVLECAMRFFYRDSFASGAPQKSHVIDWQTVPADITYHTSSFELKVLNTVFYDFFQEHIPASTDIREEFRKIDSFQVYLYAGSKDYATYKEVTGAQSNGLTGGEIKPNYSNIKGGTVLGLYTTRALKTGYSFKLEISPTIDSLRADPRTSAINFDRP